MYNLYLVLKEVFACQTYIFESDHFDGIPGAFVVVFDSFVDFAFKATSNEVFKVKTIFAYSFLSSLGGGEFLLSIAVIHHDGAVGVSEIPIGVHACFY